MKVVVWNENIHEREQPEVAAIYPKGIHGCIAEFLASEDITVTTATLDMPNHGLSEELLANTDVLIWWGHRAHDAITDDEVEMICRHINGGMGLVALHSAHHSRLFKRLMGTSCNLKWRHGDRERVWCALPSHPIAMGVPEHFELPREEMYGEPFDIPEPDETVFLGWFAGGEVFRSGVTYRRGAGKIFYFQPGHEEYPTFHDKNVQRIIRNAVKWALPLTREHKGIICENAAPIEGGIALA
ncbi:MAG: ThuA domain-containing protein [Oscillospiraceae bacterium]|nr:ThuA domain-containing protein [Oscillospiraceae bacterium]